MLGIIGGHGLFKLDGMENIEARAVSTPFGAPSAAVVTGKLFGQKVAFLPRLGLADELIPAEVNDRANLWALKETGVRMVLSIAPLVGLGIDLQAGELALVHQVLDNTRASRPSTFFGSGLAGHIAANDPVCGALCEKLGKTAHAHGVKIRAGKTLAAVDGPRFATSQERQVFEASGCHVIGMHHVPEIFLAREAGLCYAALGVVIGGEKVTGAVARDVLHSALERLQFLLKKFILNPVPLASCDCRSAPALATNGKESPLFGPALERLQFLKQS